MNAHTSNAIEGPAPLAYQAEVVRGHLCDDVNRSFHSEYKRIFREHDDRKVQIDRDYNRMSSADFLAKYDGKR